jgi:O-antigen/teichoic acid export membrane protein
LSAPAALRPAAGTDVRPQPAVDLSPPVTPNLVKRPELASAKRVGRNTLETVVFRGLSTPTALLFVVVQSRLLEPVGRGQFVVVVLGATIVTRLLGQLGVAVTSRADDEPLPLADLVQRALALGLALGVAGTGVMVGLTAALGDAPARLALIGAPAVVGNIVWQTISGVLLGQGRIRLWNVIQLLSPVLALAALLVLVAGLDTGVDGAVAGWMLANVLTAAFALVGTRDLWLPFVRPRLDAAAGTIARLALVMGVVQIVNLISYRAELFVLGHERDAFAVGVYSIAMQSVESMWLVPAAIATAVTAPVVAARSEGEAARLVARGAVRALLLAGGIAAAVGVAAPFLIPLLFGDDFKPAVRPLELLLPGVVLYAPVTVLVVYLSIRREQPRLSLLVSIVGLVVTFGGAVALVPGHGANGAALASSLGYVAGGVMAWLFFARLARRPTRVAVP